jgi:hypothetical protein
MTRFVFRRHPLRSLFLLLTALASIPVGIGAEAYDFRCRWCAMAEQARAALAAGD